MRADRELEEDNEEEEDNDDDEDNDKEERVGVELDMIRGVRCCDGL